MPVLVMGIVNRTADSFSDGGRYLEVEAAIRLGLALVEQGADIVDVGGAATNPRAAAVSEQEEIDRVVPVIEALVRETTARVSVDTTRASVARFGVAAGATIVNDISGGRFEPAIWEVAAASPEVGYVAGHVRGRSIAEVFAAEAPVRWEDVADELNGLLAAMPAGLRERTLVDPGIGFGKGADPAGNLALLDHAGDIGAATGRPVVVGPSRKRFLARLVADARGLDGVPSEAMLDAATVGACLRAVRGGADVVRVHEVTLLRTALTVYTKS
jgi:dihydropteroate synthase